MFFYVVVVGWEGIVSCDIVVGFGYMKLVVDVFVDMFVFGC